MSLTLHLLPQPFTVCQIHSPSQIDLSDPCWFFARTGTEQSLVCGTRHVPADTAAREDGWRALQVAGPLDFSLVGILAGLSSCLAAGGVSLFALSTYDTDYLLVREGQLAQALALLTGSGYQIQQDPAGQVPEG